MLKLTYMGERTAYIRKQTVLRIDVGAFRLLRKAAHAGHRRGDDRVGEIEFRRFHLGLSLVDRCLVALLLAEGIVVVFL